jgi:uncharacterized protein (DUF433 family)
MNTASQLHRITTDAEICGGRPCIRGLRMRVKDVLDLLASGASTDEILADYPYLEREDITAALQYAAAQLDHPVLHAA